MEDNIENNQTAQEIRHGGMIVGIFDEEDSSIRSFFSNRDDCSTHERLKRNKFDKPLCWRWGKNGFDFFLPNYRPFTKKEIDLIYDHILKEYKFNPIDFLNKYYYYPK